MSNRYKEACSSAAAIISIPQLSNSTNISIQPKLPSSITMKTALIILPACLLVLAHLSSAQILSTNTPPCEEVQNISPRCAAEVEQIEAEPNQLAYETFCRGDCFQSVISAYESCGAVLEVQFLQEGKKRS